MHKIDTLSFFVFSSFLQKIFLNFFLNYGSFKHISMFSFSFMKYSLIFFRLMTKLLKIWKKTNILLGFIVEVKDVMQGKIFQKCTHLLYCSVLSLGGNVNTRRMLQPDMGSIFSHKKINEIFWYRKLLCELSKLTKFNALNLLGY